MFTPRQVLMEASNRGVKMDRACIIHKREVHAKFWQENRRKETTGKTCT
jgi:hypothetical protein